MPYYSEKITSKNPQKGTWHGGLGEKISKLPSVLSQQFTQNPLNFSQQHCVATSGKDTLLCLVGHGFIGSQLHSKQDPCNWPRMLKLPEGKHVLRIKHIEEIHHLDKLAQDGSKHSYQTKHSERLIPRSEQRDSRGCRPFLGMSRFEHSRPAKLRHSTVLYLFFWFLSQNEQHFWKSNIKPSTYVFFESLQQNQSLITLVMVSLTAFLYPSSSSRAQLVSHYKFSWSLCSLLFPHQTSFSGKLGATGHLQWACVSFVSLVRNSQCQPSSAMKRFDSW